MCAMNVQKGSQKFHDIWACITHNFYLLCCCSCHYIWSKLWEDFHFTLWVLWIWSILCHI